MNSYEILKYLTVNLRGTKYIDDAECTATGFFVMLDDKPVIITAKHFAENVQPEIVVPVHYMENKTVITLPVSAVVMWEYSEEYDIAYCSIEPIEKKFKEITGKPMFYTAISQKDIITKEEFKKINILTEVLTIGYPCGISSTHHEFPLFKKGYISSLPSDFTEDGLGFLDLCAEKGCSGSPVFLNNSQLKLVGILVRYISDDGNPNKTTAYVSADKIFDIKNENM